jgi:hypothetical protein
MTSQKQSINAVEKVKKAVVGAMNPVDENATRSERRRIESQRKKLTQDMKKQGLNQEEIDHYFFVQDNAKRANEAFASMQKLLNNLGYYVKGKLNVTERGIIPSIDLGMIPFAQFKKMKVQDAEDKKADEKRKLENFKNGAGFDVKPVQK